MVKALPFIHQLDRVARKACDVSAADWRYQTHVKKYHIFSRVLLQHSRGLYSLGSCLKMSITFDLVARPKQGVTPPTSAHLAGIETLSPQATISSCLALNSLTPKND